MRYRSTMAAAVAALTLVACGNETDSAPPDTVTPAGVVLYTEVDLTLAEDQEKGLSALVKSATGKEPSGDPLLATLEMITDGKAGPFTKVRGDLGWIGDRIAYASVAPLRDTEDHGVVATVKDAGDGIDAIGSALGEDPRDAKLAGKEATRFGSTGTYAAEIEGGYLVVGGRNFVEQVVKTGAGGKKLSDRAAYKRAIQGRSRQLAKVFLDLPKASSLSARVKKKAEYNLGENALDEPYVYGIDVADQTATFDQFAGGTELDGIGVTPLVKEAPADAWAVLGAVDLRKNGTRLLSDFASLAAAPEIKPQAARAALRSVGMDLERDVFGWMGDAVIWVAGESEAKVRVGLLMEAKRTRQARAGIAKLRSLLSPVKGAPTDFTVPLDDGSRLKLALDGGVVSFVYEGKSARAVREKVLDGPLGKDVEPALKGQEPAMLVDVTRLADFVKTVGGENDRDWKAIYRVMRPFSSVVGVAGPKGAPRIVGRIR